MRLPYLTIGGFEVFVSPFLEDWKTEYYRGVGGFQNRWQVRKSRQIRVNSAIIMPSQRMMMVSPLTMKELAERSVLIKDLA